jgi:outer membrane receptor for ferrienterochelin and colicins
VLLYKRFRPFALAFIIAGMLLSAVSPVHGQGKPQDLSEMSLEELMAVKVSTVVGASKREQSLSEAPSSVTIISSQDIQQYGYRTLADILNSVPGLYVTTDDAYSFLGVRGFNRPGDYGGRVLLLLDGHRLNEPVFDTASFSHDFILDVDLIDRVEIVRGPGSALYGDNAFFAVVNVISKRGKDFHWGEAAGHGGSLDTYQGRVSVGHRFADGMEFLLSGTNFGSDGQKRIQFQSANPTNPLPNNGVAENLDYERNQSFFAKLQYNDFTLTAAYNSRLKGVPNAAFGIVFNDPRFWDRDQQEFVDLKFDKALGDGWSVMTRVFYSRYAYDSDSPFDYANTGIPVDFVINHDFSRSQWAGTEIQLGKKWERVQLTTGGEFRRNFQEHYENQDLNPSFTYTNINQTDSTWGLFANVEVPLYRKYLTIDAGVRYDGFTRFDPAVNPRVALIARPFNKTTLKAIYGQAYRTPNVYEANYSGLGAVPNPDLKPETIHSYEAVWEQKYGEYFRSTLSGYLNQVRDLINLTGVGLNLFEEVNLGKINAKGVEMALEWRDSSTGIRGRASYAFQQTWDELQAQQLNNSPQHLAKFNLVVPLYHERLSAALEVRGQSAVTSTLGTTINGFWLVNATLFTQKIFKSLDLSVSADNLTGARYAFPGSPALPMASLPQPGRSVQVGFSYGF